MKLLLDENLSRRIIPLILDVYPESSQIYPFTEIRTEFTLKGEARPIAA